MDGVLKNLCPYEAMQSFEQDDCSPDMWVKAGKRLSIVDGEVLVEDIEKETELEPEPAPFKPVQGSFF